MSDLHVKQAELLMESRLYVEAKWELEKAVKINPWNAQAYADLTQVYSYARDYEKVIEAARRAQVNWNIPNIHNRKAFAYLELGEINKAKKALSRCMFLYPNFSAGYINRGYISLLEGEKNLKRGKPKLAEEKLNESFLYYVQGSPYLKDNSPLHCTKQKKKSRMENGVLKNFPLHFHFTQEKIISYLYFPPG